MSGNQQEKDTPPEENRTRGNEHERDPEVITSPVEGGISIQRRRQSLPIIFLHILVWVAMTGYEVPSFLPCVSFTF